MCRSCSVCSIEAKDEPPRSESTYFICCLNTTTGSNNHDEAFASINLPDFDHSVKFKLDSGAQINTMPRNFYSKFASMQNLPSSNSLLCAYGGFPVDSFGTVLLKCKHGDVVENHLFMLLIICYHCFLGLKTCLSMGLLKISCPVKPKTSLECNSLLDKYSDVFRGIGCLAQLYTILTDNNVTPVRCPPRRIPFASTNNVKAKLDSMVAQHVIEPVKEKQATATHFNLAQGSHQAVGYVGQRTVVFSAALLNLTTGPSPWSSWIAVPLPFLVSRH